MLASRNQQASTRPRAPGLGWVGVALVLATIAVRAPGWQRPLVGHFATKNVAYAMIARNWALGHAPFERPTLDLLVGGQPALHLLELPLPAYLAGAAWHWFGGSLDAWGRGLTIAASGAAVGLLFTLVRRWHGPRVAVAAGLAWAFSPISIVIGQSFMLETWVVLGSLLCCELLERWRTSQQSRWLVGFTLVFACTLATKPYLAMLAPVFLALGLSDRGETADAGRPAGRAARAACLSLAMLAAALPVAAWYFDIWRSTAPGGVDANHVYYSVRDSAAVHGFPHPLLGEPRFYAQLARDLASQVLTPLGLLLALLGLAQRGARRHAALLLASALLVAVLPLKFHKQVYYFVVVLPALCLLVGLGWERVQTGLAALSLSWRDPVGRWTFRLAPPCIALAAAAVGLTLAYRPAFTIPAEDRAVVASAAAARAICAAHEPLVTMHGSTFDVLYYSQRRGWALSPIAPRLADELAACHAAGARHLVWCCESPARFPTAEALLASQTLVSSGPGYRVYRLTAAATLGDASSSALARDASPAAASVR